MTLKIALIFASAFLSIISTFILFANGIGAERIGQLSAYFQFTNGVYRRILILICLILLIVTFAITFALVLGPYSPKIWDGGPRAPGQVSLIEDIARNTGVESEKILKGYYEELWPILNRTYFFVGFVAFSIAILLLFMFLVRKFTNLVITRLIGLLYIELSLAGFVVGIVFAVIANFVP